MKNFCKAAIFSTSLLISICFAQQNKVLIVNTNTSIQRYEKISTEFKTILQKNTYRWVEFNLEAHNNPENDLQQLIQAENPGFIYCIGSKAYSLSQNYAEDKFLLFSAAINWNRLSIGDKTYGIANELSPEQEMTFLRMFFPAVKRIGLLYSQEFTQEYVETVKKDAATLNIEIIDQQIDNITEIKSALNELLPKIDIFWVISDPLVLGDKEAIMQIFQITKQQKKPVYAYSDVFIKYGAVLSVSADTATIGRQSATLIMSLKEADFPGNMVQLPAGSNITLNMCTVDALSMNLNKEALASVNKIVSCDQQ